MSTRRATPPPRRTGYHLRREQQEAQLERMLESLRTERYQAEMDLKRWAAIPEQYRDGTELDGIEGAKKRIAICEAQIDALT